MVLAILVVFLPAASIERNHSSWTLVTTWQMPLMASCEEPFSERRRKRKSEKGNSKNGFISSHEESGSVLKVEKQKKESLLKYFYA